MPRVQYVNNFRNQSITRDLPTPKRMSELRYWLKGAQAQIQEIPKNIAESISSQSQHPSMEGWYIENTDVDTKWIKFNLANRIGERAHIVIDRQVKF